MRGIDYLNLSTDLRRISVWLVTGREDLATSFIDKTFGDFFEEKRSFGKLMIGEWLARIADFRRRGWKSAEDALTLSILLKNRIDQNY